MITKISAESNKTSTTNRIIRPVMGLLLKLFSGTGVGTAVASGTGVAISSGLIVTSGGSVGGA